MREAGRVVHPNRGSNRFGYILTFVGLVPNTCRSKCSSVHQAQFHHKTADCPICEKYGNGPCGPYFWNWWNCTEENTQDFADKCSGQFLKFQTCVDRHMTTDSMPLTTNNNNKEEGDDVAQAWDRFVTEELASIPREHFPNELEPDVTLSFNNRLGEIAFFSHNGDMHLVAAIIRRNDGPAGTTVIAASAATDMVEEDGKRILAFLTPPGVKNISILAIYENEHEAVQVFHQSIALAV